MKSPHKIVWILMMTVLLTLVFGACSSSGADGDVEPDSESEATVEDTNTEAETETGETAVPPAAQPEGNELPGTSWILTSFGPNDNQTAVLPNTELTLNFEGDQINGSSGCNSYFADVTVEADGKLAVGLVGSTLMACLDEDVTQQESDFLATLSQATSYTLSGNELTLHTDDSSLIFYRSGNE